MGQSPPTPDLSIIFYFVEGEGKMGFCKEDRDV
jgi:hypothetical protein